jgi:hypothetical protein
MSADSPDFIDPSAAESSHRELYILPNIETPEYSSNLTLIKPYSSNSSEPDRGYHYPPADAWITVSKTGMELGEHELYTDRQNKVHTTEVLYSEMYDLKASTVTGNVTGYFYQYTHGYTGDKYGAIHPRKLAWTGNETRRVLTVTYNSQTGEVTRGYIKGKDLRYALEDKARLERTRLELKRLKEVQPNAYIQPTEAEVSAEKASSGAPMEEREEYPLAAG